MYNSFLKKPKNLRGVKDMDNVTITKQEYDRLQRRDAKLSALEATSVDNWEGYSVAMDMLEEE